MRTKILCLGIIGAGILVSAGIIINGTFAQTTPTDIKYPVAELGNCKNQEDCKAYCDDSSRTDVCLAFAQKNNLMSQSEVDSAKKFMEAGSKGPGGCVGETACKAYCDDISRIDECVAFAEKTGILPPDQLAEAKQVQTAIAKGVTPPPCSGKKECDAYCENPSHMKVCVVFGEAAGFLKGKELDDAKKILAAIDKGVTPPPCKGKDACDAYCSSPEHIEVCMAFSQAAGLMSPEEAQNSQKMIDAVKKGVKPPNCKGKEACDAYCSEDAHVDECINFSIAAGFMNEKETAMAKKTKGKGPGDCKSKDVCDAFCNNPDNQQTCFNFAKENGMISAKDAQQMEQGQKKFQESMQNLPSEVGDCVRNAVGNNLFDKLKNGQAVPPKEMTEKIGSCFSKMQPPPGQQGPDQNFQPMPQQAGPGGCKGPEECKVYCESHPDECKNSKPNIPGPNQMPPPPDSMNKSPQEFAPGTGPNTAPPEGTILPPLPSTAPGAGGILTPGMPVPLAPPTELTPPPTEPTAPAPQSLEYNLQNPLRATINYFGEILSK